MSKTEENNIESQQQALATKPRKGKQAQELAAPVRQTPQDKIKASSEMIAFLSPIIQKHHIATIQGRKYIMVTGAQALASSLGYTTKVVRCTHNPAANGIAGHWEAVAVVVDGFNQAEIAEGVGHVFDDEKPWGSRPRFAQAAMAQTRATGRALKGAVGWMFAMVGAQSSLAEEMPFEQAEHSALPAAESPSMDDETFSRHSDLIMSASTMEGLQTAFVAAYREANALNDKRAISEFTKSKDRRKKELTQSEAS